MTDWVRLQPDAPLDDGVTARTRYLYALNLFGPDNYRTRHWKSLMIGEER